MNIQIELTVHQASARALWDYNGLTDCDLPLSLVLCLTFLQQP